MIKQAVLKRVQYSILYYLFSIIVVFVHLIHCNKSLRIRLHGAVCCILYYIVQV